MTPHAPSKLASALRGASAARAVTVQHGPQPPTDGVLRTTLHLNGSTNEEDRPNNYAKYAEIQRICAVPVCRRITPQELEAYCRENILADAFEGRDGSTHQVFEFDYARQDWTRTSRYEPGFRFFPMQAEAILGYELSSGVCGTIGVGDGKTLSSLMIAQKALLPTAQGGKGHNSVVLLIPAQVLAQLINDVKWARTKVPINYPVHFLGGKPPDQRKALAHSGKRGLYVFPYSLASGKDAQECLEAIKPGLVIADEAQNLSKHKSTARARRVMGYVNPSAPDKKRRGLTGQEPPVEMVVLSGTITHKGLNDYSHLIRAALKNNNPLPNSDFLVNEWAAVIDAQATNEVASSQGMSGPMMPLVHWAKKHFPDYRFDESVAGFRAAFRRRLNSSPGVVYSGDAQIGTSLIIHNNNIPKEEYQQAAGWGELDRLITKVEDMWETPNGDQIEHAIHTWKWLNELSAGFYNELTWPTDAAFAERKQISQQESADTLAAAKKHHAAGQEYHKWLRKFLSCELPGYRPSQGFDTPMLVGNDMARHGEKHVPSEMYEAWLYWKSLDFEHRPDRDSRAVRVCPYKIDRAVDWAASLPKGTGAIVWYYHQEVGSWLFEELVKRGLDALHCPAGNQFNRTIIDPANKHKIIVASMTAHGTGKNLQHFSEQWFVQWPRDARAAEQTIGRTHRSGQLADELVVNTCITLEFDELNLAACLNDALYFQQTTGNRQKIIYASYDPMPKIFPPAVLVERGLQAKMLNAAQQRELQERFSLDTSPPAR